MHNDKLFSIEDEWESIDSFYLSFYKVTFGDSRSYEKRIQDILYIGNHNIILGFWGHSHNYFTDAIEEFVLSILDFCQLDLTD